MIIHSLLCLGDSYTIGEGVPLHESFPYQLVQMLRAKGTNIFGPEVIAQTGWTTTELNNHLSKIILRKHYDFVTLLIGVNNQYRNLPVHEFEEEFTLLLENAISLAEYKPEHVVVLSIPDWGVTPFAEGRDNKLIASQIDEFNKRTHTISKNYKVHYIDNTESTRKASNDSSLLTTDTLHPSGKEYKKWAEKVFEVIHLQISKQS